MKDLLGQLPEEIEVSIKRGDSGCFIVEIPKLNIFTEADTTEDITYMVNDLLYTYFDVPKKYQGKIWYRPNQ